MIDIFRALCRPAEPQKLVVQRVRLLPSLWGSAHRIAVSATRLERIFEAFGASTDALRGCWIFSLPLYLASLFCYTSVNSIAAVWGGADSGSGNEIHLFWWLTIGMASRKAFNFVVEEVKNIQWCPKVSQSQSVSQFDWKVFVLPRGSRRDSMRTHPGLRALLGFRLRLSPSLWWRVNSVVRLVQLPFRTSKPSKATWKGMDTMKS